MKRTKEDRRTYRVTAGRTIFPFAYMSAAAEDAISDGKADRSGSFFKWMTAAVFSAFSLEAYLNHLGAERFKCWEDLERLPVEAKLSLILEDLGKLPDLSRRPFQTVKTLLRLRNQLAHGRTERLEEKTIQTLSPGQRPRYPAVKWEALCTETYAERFHQDSMDVIRQLDEWAGHVNPFLFSLEEGFRSVSPIETAEQVHRADAQKRRGSS
jgi:hypothetical protein